MQTAKGAELEFVDRLAAVKVVPVVEIPDPASAVPLARALLGAGLACAEITLRTPAAIEAIRAMSQTAPTMYVGAGTVLSCAQADEAVDAGAQFLVAPGLNPDVVAHAQSLGVPMLPGVCTPSDIEAAVARGVSLVKFFPAEAIGGVRFLAALAGPYREVKFVPTGGIGPANLHGYLNHPSVVACGGSWMVKKDLIASGSFDVIGRLVAEALDLASGVGAEGVSAG